MKLRSSIFLALVFASGAAGLIYQMVWFRQLRLVFGLSTAAHAAVLAVFLGGLGLGGALLGRRADRHPRPMHLYGTLEILVALAAAATPLLLRAARDLYLMTGGEAELGLTAATLVRGLVAVLVLAAPTVLLGGTLPALVRAFETEGDSERRRTALAYGINTLGGVVGVLLATFLLIELLGELRTIVLAACISAVVGVVARRLAGAGPVAGEAPQPSSAAPAEAPGLPPALVLAAAAATGFIFFLMEIVWYRMLGPILGGTTFTFGVILAVALLGIAAGGGLYALVAKGRPATPAAFATTCALEGLALALPLGLGDDLALVAALSSDFSSLGFGGSLLSWFLVTVPVVLPAALIAGYQFPLMVALLGTGRRAVGLHVGLAYASNTAGSIAGALLGGFVLLTAYGAVACWRLGVVMCFGLSLLTLLVAQLQPRARAALRPYAGAVIPLLVVALGAQLLASPGPTAAWRHGGIGAGRAALAGRDANTLRRFVHGIRRNLVWEADGRESSVGLEASTAYAFVLNGKVDGNAVNDAGTQVMSGLLGALLHPEPRTALVVGLGTGSTAGWLAEVASIECVHVVELEPKIEHIARVCAPVNRAVLDNPKATVAYGDAREALLTSRDRYDLVVSEPSNPYRAGIASLFTADFYAHVRDRLSDDGLFLQWFQGYEVDTGTVAVVINTLGSVFGEVEVWRTLKNDLLLVASVAPRELDAAILRERVAAEPYASAMRFAWQSSGLEGMLARYVGGDGLVRALAATGSVEINTDDRNLLEFMLAKSVGRHGLFEVETMVEAARRMGAGRPPFVSGPLQPDWELVERERIGAFHESPDAEWEDLRPLLEFQRAWRRDDAATALEAWQKASLAARTDLEQLGLAAAASSAAAPEAEAAIAVLVGRYDTEAALLTGRFELARGEPGRAAEAFERAVARLRKNPWADAGAFDTLFRDLDRIANEDPALAPVVLDLLARPLAVERGRDERLWVRLRVAWLLGMDDFAEVLDEVEPWVPWDLWLLQRRAAARQHAGDPRAQAALGDVGAYARNAPQPFTSLVSSRPRPAPERDDPAGDGVQTLER